MDEASDPFLVAENPRPHLAPRGAPVLHGCPWPREAPLRIACGRRRAAGDVDVHRYHAVDAAERRVRSLAEDPAAAAARADRHHDARLGGRLVGAAQSDLHVAGHGPRHEQHIGVPGARDEVDAEPFEVEYRVGGGGDLELAAVAAPGVHLTDVSERPNRPRMRRAERAADSPGWARGDLHPTERRPRRSPDRRRRTRDWASCSRRVRGDLDIVASRSPLLGTGRDAFAALDARRVRQGQRLAARRRESPSWMAPVGQARAQSSHAVQRRSRSPGSPTVPRVPNGSRLGQRLRS